MDNFESRLIALAGRGFGVNLDVRKNTYGQRAGNIEFSVRLSKGESYHGSGITANGVGASLDEAASAALRAAEAFLKNPEPPAAVESALGDMALALPPAAE